MWTTALARYQFLLRQGRPRIDVGILRTDHFTDNMSGMAFFDASGERRPDSHLLLVEHGRRRGTVGRARGPAPLPRVATMDTSQLIADVFALSTSIRYVAVRNDDRDSHHNRQKQDR